MTPPKSHSRTGFLTVGFQRTSPKSIKAWIDGDHLNRGFSACWKIIAEALIMRIICYKNDVHFSETAF